MQTMSKSLQIVFLTGFMGSGKTTVGKKLAHKLGWRFVDSDQLIESRTKMSVAEIFQKHGEIYFRELEHKTLREFRNERRCVVSLGGGIVENPHNRKILEKGFWIFLHVPFAVLARRLANNTTRPLAQDGLATPEELYRKRLPFYRLAHLKWNCQQLAPDAIANQIALRLKGFGGK